MRLLAIDPGAHTGFAFFIDGVLMSVCVGRPDEPYGRDVAPDITVIEFPKRNYGRARPEDLLKLAGTAGRYIERFCKSQVELVAPTQWKGTIDGDIMCARIEAALTPGERALLPHYAKTVRHNALDAIGLGKWALRQPFVRRPRAAK